MERYDSEFYEIVYDESGQPKTQLKRQIAKREGEYFDTSYGHCGLCGSLGCNGRCFK